MREMKIDIRQLPEKINEVVWDGTDNNKKPVSSGIYLYQLKVNEETKAVRKMIILK